MSAPFTADLARELFRYDPETGLLYWQQRSLHHFKDRSYWRRWNAKWAGKETSSISPTGYKRLNYRGQFYLVHRVVWLVVHGEWPDVIDHVNGIKQDNRLVNLRAVSQCENARNARLFTTNTSGVVGVSFDARDNRWHAYIGVGKNHRQSLGHFKTKEEAIAARRAAELVLGYHENHGRAA